MGKLPDTHYFHRAQFIKSFAIQVKKDPCQPRGCRIGFLFFFLTGCDLQECQMVVFCPLIIDNDPSFDLRNMLAHGYWFPIPVATRTKSKCGCLSTDSFLLAHPQIRAYSVYLPDTESLYPKFFLL
jgi:hypothetical protein